MGKKKKVVRKPKKQRKGKLSSKKYEKYTVEGTELKRAMSCPKCGPGVFLADHSNRLVCGKCGYVEMK